MLSGCVQRTLVSTWQFWRRGWDLKGYFTRESEDIPTQDPYDVSRCQTSLMRYQIRFVTSGKFRSSQWELTSRRMQNSQTQSICYPSQGQARSLNLRKKLRLERKRVSHPLKRRVIKVATVVWEIMIIKVVRSKWKNVTTATRTAIL